MAVQRDDDIEQIISTVSTQRIRRDIDALAGPPAPRRTLNVTRPGAARCTLYEADAYLTGQLRQAGYAVQRLGMHVQAFRRDRGKSLHHQYAPPEAGDRWYIAYNLVAEKPGTAASDHVIITVAHKDSQSWIASPGANDNAVGTAACVELARVLRHVDTRCALRFVLCNEEHTPWTSLDAARRASEAGETLPAVFNLDGLGRKGPEASAQGRMTNVTLYTKPDGEALATLMGDINAVYGLGLEQSTYQRKQPGDDDGSFIKTGYPTAVCCIGSYPYADPNYHTEGDTADTVDVNNAALALKLVAATLLTVDRSR